MAGGHSNEHRDKQNRHEQSDADVLEDRNVGLNGSALVVRAGELDGEPPFIVMYTWRAG
jgi:hypothetical protein